MRSAVHFGAGNIGRGFIGLLLHQAGYHVTFVDVNTTTVNAIQALGRYVVRLAASDPAPVTVTGIAAVNGADSEAVASAVANADLVTTAVGPQVLRTIAPAVARGLQARADSQPPVIVIACENLIGASEQLARLVGAASSNGFASRAVFANCAVDRIVPVQPPGADPLTVTVEPFFEWVIDASAFTLTAAPNLPGARFVRELSPYIERKLFTVNTGHAALAYLGFRAGCRFIHEAISRPDIHAITLGAVRESGVGLIARHGFAPAEHEHYIEKVLERFANPLLADEVIRVGRSPLRKLGSGERLVAPAINAAAAGTPPSNLARVIAAALRFDFSGDPEAVELLTELREKGVADTLTRVTRVPADDPLHRAVVTRYAQSQGA